MGVYSGVYEYTPEYTQQIQEQIPSIQSIRVFGAFAELQAGSLQYNLRLLRKIVLKDFSKSDESFSE